MGLGGVESFGSVAAIRFLLGVFEAGLFPGLVYYLSMFPMNSTNYEHFTHIFSVLVSTRGT